MLLHALHVHLQTCEEHDVVESHSAEELEGVVALKDVESVFSDQDARQYHTDDMRDTQLTHHDRSKENNQQHHKEDQCGVGDGEICRQ